MVSQANYGGRVTDPQDKRTVQLLLRDYFNPAVVENDNQPITESGAYYIPDDMDRKGYIEFCEALPLTDTVDIFGMHDNADITANQNASQALLAVALTLQPRVAGGGGKSKDDILMDMTKDIIARLPKTFDTERATKAHPICYENSMNTVLAQELLRYNKMTKVIRQSCIDIGRAIKGEVVMSTELEIVADALMDNIIPPPWKKLSYNTLKPLASFIIDLLKRLQMYFDWIDNG